LKCSIASVLFLMAGVLLCLALGDARAADEQLYQVTLRVIEADTWVAPGTVQVPAADLTTTDAQFAEQLSTLNPGCNFTLPYSLSATTPSGYPFSLAVRDQKGGINVTATPTPTEAGILVALEFVQTEEGGRSFQCETVILLKEGQGWVVGATSRSDGSSLIILSLVPVAPIPLPAEKPAG